MPYTWTSSSGKLTLTFPSLELCTRCSHPGPCDLDVRDVSEEPEIAEQLATIDVAQLAAELREYGAWDAEELADHAQNLQRLLWCAACDVHMNPGFYLEA
jgi:hypothetical protein